jgi:hypothetical protein
VASSLAGRRFVGLWVARRFDKEAAVNVHEGVPGSSKARGCARQGIETNGGIRCQSNLGLRFDWGIVGGRHSDWLEGTSIAS